MLQSQESNWFPEHTPEENYALQQQDKNLSMIFSWKKEGKRPKWEDISKYDKELKNLWAQWDRLELQDNVLYRKWVDLGIKTTNLQLVVPKAIRKDIFKSLHESMHSGHLGVRKTIGKIRRRAYWSGYKTDITDWCRQCSACQKRKNPQRKFRAPMKQYQVGLPMERVAIDILGPLPESYQGNKYIMIVTDYFTRWTEAFAIPNQKASTIACTLVSQFISRFGIPRQIHTDQGTQFESYLFQDLCRLLDIDKTRTTALHPQSDGLVKPFNKTLEDMISKYIGVDQRGWDSALGLLLMAYRTAEHESTGYSPNRMMFGREPLLPADLVTGTRSDKGLSDHSTYVTELSEQMELIHDIAREKMQEASNRQKKGYDHRKNLKNYQPGDAVYLFNPCRKKGVSPKLQSFWEGPFLIVEKISDLVYKIQSGPSAKTKIVHHDRLKPCFERVDSWLKGQDKTQATYDNTLVKTPLTNHDISIDLQPANLILNQATLLHLIMRSLKIISYFMMFPKPLGPVK